MFRKYSPTPTTHRQKRLKAHLATYVWTKINSFDMLFLAARLLVYTFKNRVNPFSSQTPSHHHLHTRSLSDLVNLFTDRKMAKAEKIKSYTHIKFVFFIFFRFSDGYLLCVCVCPTHSEQAKIAGMIRKVLLSRYTQRTILRSTYRKKGVFLPFFFRRSNLSFLRHIEY